MSLAEEFEYTERTKRIREVQFGILSPQRILEQSVAEIFKPIPSNQNEPFDGTLMDPRLGSNEKSELNKISDLDYKHDPGNFGHLHLAKPVIQAKFYETVIKILNMVCYKCSNLLIDKGDEDILKAITSKKGKHRLPIIKKFTQKRPLSCPSCGVSQPKFIKGKEKTFVYQIVANFSGQDEKSAADKDKKTFNPEMVYHILKHITDEDCLLIGLNPKFARPDWMLWTVMPIPPPTVRPSIKLENGQQAEDDLTMILNHIINDNIGLLKALQKKEGEKTEKTIIERWSLLQLHVAAYIDNEQSAIDTVTNRSNKPLRTLRSRIKAKKGRLRNNLMGKRVDYSSRSVITPDPLISIDELGIPIYVATTLDYKEVVTEFNISVLNDLVQRGPDTWPGANKIQRLSGDRKRMTVVNLKYVRNRSQLRLRIGDIVYRHLMDGDWVLFNRQPSLHKMSMMAHRVKVLSEGDTFRLNVNVTSPYNADFDGDEMNMHLPRSYQTMLEFEILCAVPTQIVSPQASAPVIGLVQDSRLGAFRWSLSDRHLDAYKTMRLMSWTSTYNGFLPEPEDPKKGWLAPSIISTILPEITIINKDDDRINRLIIEHGVYKDGVISGNSAGKKLGTIVHRIWRDFGPETTRQFMDNIMRLTMQWLLMDGFSIGLVDTVISEETKTKIKEMVDQVYVESAQKITDLREGNLKVKFSNMSVVDFFEMEMQNMLKKVRDSASSLTIKALDQSNRFWATVTSGSKGSNLNLVYTCGILGQQMLEGQKRIDSGFQNRTLPHYAKYDMRPESHGFIQSNFRVGLNPVEYFLHAISGREGVISTAIRTGITGYQQRKLIKTMEDFQVVYDHTVRNANNFIISHRYGGDGFDGSKVERERFDYFKLGKKAFETRYGWTNAQLEEVLDSETHKKFMKGADFGPQFLQDELSQMWDDHEELRYHVYKDVSAPEGVYSPVNFRTTLTWVKYTCGINGKKKTNLHPGEVINKVRNLVRDVHLMLGRIQDPNNAPDWYVTPLFVYLIRAYLNSKELIYKHRLTSEALDLLLLRVKNFFLDARVSPGEMVGIIAAQSIGEPLTQLTLDTFHQTGASGIRTSKIVGIPRLQEIFRTTAAIKTPSLTMYLDQESIGLDKNVPEEEAKRKAEDILDKIKYTALEKLLSSERGCEFWVDPDEDNSLIEEDREWLAEVREIEPYSGSTPWLVRLLFDSKKIQNITLEEIDAKLKSKLPKDMIPDIVYTDINAKDVIMRIRVNVKSDDPKKELRDITKKILLTQVKGLNNILGGSVGAIDRNIILPDGDILTKGDPGYDDYLYTDKDKKLVNPLSKEYIIMTEGSNLHDALALDIVQKYRTLSNNIHEVLDVLGIEAAREMIIREIEDEIGKYVSRRHVSTLADVMTAQGVLVSIDRYGVNKTDTGVLSRATFEETTKMISQAAIFGESDPVTGVSANIMFGQFFRGGTNSVDVFIDEEMLLDPKIKLYDQEEKRRRLRKQARVEVSEQIVDACQDLDFEFQL